MLFLLLQFLVYLTSSLSPYYMQIMLGEHNLQMFEGTEQLMKIDTIIWHPKWVKKLTTLSFRFYFAQFNDHLINLFSAEEQKTPIVYFSVCSYDYQTLDYDIMLIDADQALPPCGGDRSSRSHCPQGAHMRGSVALCLAGVTLPWMARVGG